MRHLIKMSKFCIINISFAVVNAVVVLSSFADEGCQPGAYRYQEFCYSYIATPQPFDQAVKACSGRGGLLATIKDHNTARFIRAFHKRMTALSYWIGLSDRNTEGKWLYPSDNSTIQYENWNRWEPNDAGQNQDCAAIRVELGLVWDDNCCCDKILYICQFEGFSNRCRGNNRLGGNCYELFRQRVLFTEAEKRCSSIGGKLAEIKTNDVQRFLEEKIQQEMWWKYLTDQQMDQFTDWNFGAWIGVFKAHGKWIYSDGSKVTEPLWKIGQPSDKENADCVLVADQWMSDTCDKLYSSICQFEADIRPIITTKDILPTLTTNHTQQTPALNDNSEFPTLMVASIIGSTAIIVCIFVVFMIIYHRRFQTRLVGQLQLPPPVPRREEMHPNLQNATAMGLHSSNDDYLIMQEPLYLQPRNDYSHMYHEIIDSNSYASVNEYRMAQYKQQ